MKQWIQRMAAAFVLLVFMLSIVPLALAKEKNEQETEQASVADPVTGVFDESKGPQAGEPRDDTTELQNAREKRVRSVAAAKLKLADRREKVAENTAESLRGQAAERLDELKEKYQDARHRYVQSKENYAEHREKLAQLKSAVKECKGKDGEETVGNETCASKNSDLKRGLRVHLIKTTELLDRSLEKLLSKVEQSNVLTEEEKADAVAAIMELETKLTAQKEAVEALAENASNEELRAAIKDLKSLWQDVRKQQRHIVAMLISSRYDALVEKHQEFANGLEVRLEELEKAGVSAQDLKRLRSLLDDFKEVVAQLEADNKKAEEIFGKVKAGEESIDVWHTQQKRVQKDLRESKKILRDFLHAYKELKKESVESTSEVTVESETTVESESSGSTGEVSAEASTEATTV